MVLLWLDSQFHHLILLLLLLLLLVVLLLLLLRRWNETSKTTMDQLHISSSGSTTQVPSPVIQPAPVSKSNEIPEKNPYQPPIPYPSRLNKDKLQYKPEKLGDLRKFSRVPLDDFSEQWRECFMPQPISPTPSSDLVVASLSPSLTPFGDIDFLLEETDDFLALDDSIPPEIDNGIYGPTPHLDYAFLEGTSKLPVIITKDLKREEKDQLIKVLKSHKRAIAWKISDIRGIDSNFCTHKILMETDFKPAVQHQRRVNLKIHEIIKVEVIKLAGLIYPISNSPWVSPVHIVPKKGDQMLERLDGNEFYCFLDGFYGYFQIPIDRQDQEKTTFTCPYGNFAYPRMPFGLYNAPGTFQRCMVAIFHDMIEKTIEVFMDDFLVYEDSFSSCLSHLDMMLKRCEDTNLVLNWERCHFMVKEGIVLGHKISKSRIKVDKAKVDVIVKLPPPTTVKGIQSFLECMESFEFIKKKLTEDPILVASDWDLPFEIMCDASDFAFDIKIHDKKGAENLAADHLSRLENPYKGDLVEMEMNDNFPHESLNMIALNDDNELPWYLFLLAGFPTIVKTTVLVFKSSNTRSLINFMIISREIFCPDDDIK
ncbi:reverse transcriptase domain-containing protein [Tanacetum coccineum]|uniref:Reverse transcriptase domain-containing protein n=1 Tax=Tanacetum coccineum TaxID=301880 RepID=A0ABQ5AVX1_9ASTR